MVETKKKSWLLIGTGNIANHYAKALNYLFKKDNFYVIPSSELSKSYYNFSKKYNNFIKINYDEINELNNLSPLICTPEDNHIFIIKKLLKTNAKYIYCEKPLTLNINELKNLKKYSDRLYGLFNRRFYEIQKYLTKSISNVLFVNAKISISRTQNNFRENFLPHFLDFILHTFPNISNNFKMGNLSSSIKNINYSSDVFNKKLIPINITILESKFVPSTIEIILSDQKVINLMTLEKLAVYKYSISKSASFTNQINQIQDMYLDEEELTTNGFKPGFLQLLNAIKNDDISKMHNFDDALNLSNLINKL